MTLAFVDTETTGLDPDLHEIWEVGLIIRETDEDREYLWQLPVDLGRADAVALRIGHFHERRWPGQGLESEPKYAERDARKRDGARLTEPRSFARDFAALTRGRHLVGAVPSFDDERLRKLLRANGACPEWHYHLIDVEALAVGYLYGRSDADFQMHPDPRIPLPWNSNDLTERLGIVVPPADVRHTALGDARWAKSIYDHICGDR